MKKVKLLSLLAIASLLTFTNTAVNAQVNNSGLEKETFILVDVLPDGQHDKNLSFTDDRLRIEGNDFLNLSGSETFFLYTPNKDFHLPTYNNFFRPHGNKDETLGRVAMGVGVPLIFLGLPGTSRNSDFIRTVSGHGPQATDWIFVSAGLALTGTSIYLLNKSKVSSGSMAPLSEEDINFYQRKRSKLKTYAWISLGVGPPMMIASWVFAVTRGDDYIGLRRFAMRFLWNTGVVLTTVSIPLFITASSYKKRTKSTNLSFNMQRIDLPVASGISSVVQPEMKFSIAL